MSTRRYSSEYKALRPFIIEEIRGILGGSVAVAGAVGGIASHALNDTSIHTGQLAQTQAPWASTKNELATHAANPDAHHAKQHVLANASGLGTDHTISGAVAGWVLRATAATTARFMQLSHADLGGVAPDQHHAQQHNITGTDHTIVGAQYQIVGATGTNTLGLLTPSATPGAAAAILRTTTAGLLTLKTLDVTDFLYVDGTLDFGTNTLYEDATYLQVAGSKPLRFGQNIGNANWTIYNAGGATFSGNVELTGNSDLSVAGSGFYAGNPVLFADSSGGNVGILCNPDPQFALDVNGPARAQYFIGPHAIQLKDALLIAHYDGPDPSSVVGEPNGHFGQVGTIAGGVAFRPGKFNKALQVAPAGQNDVGNSRPNPSGSKTGWHGHAYDMSGSLSPASVTAANAPFVGSKAIGVTYTYSLASVVDFTARAGTYTLTAWVRVVGRSDATISLGMGWGGTGGSIDYIWTPTTLANAVDGQWYLMRFTAPSTTVAATRGVVIKTLVPTSGSHRLEVANVQAELSSFPTPYMDGDMGDGYAWAGTAYASASTRTVGSLSYTGLPVQWRALTMMGWVRLETTAAAAGRGLAVGEIRINNANRYALFFDNGTDRLQAYLTAGGTSATLTSSTAAAAQTWHHVAVTVNGTAAALFLNGAQVASGTLANAPAGLATAYVGTSGLVTPLNGMVDDFALINRALTAMDVRAVYESDAPVFAESSVWSFRATAKGLVWADDEGLWMRDVGGNPVLGIYGGEAPTKSWGGFSMKMGDLVMGRNAVGSAAFRWQQETGEFGFYGNGNGTPQVEISTAGEIVAGAGAVKMGLIGLEVNRSDGSAAGGINGDGFWLDKGGPRTSVNDFSSGSRLHSAILSEFYEADSETFTYSSTTFERNPLVIRNAAGSYVGYTGTAYVELSAWYSNDANSSRIILNAGAWSDMYSTTYGTARVIELNTHTVLLSPGARLWMARGDYTNEWMRFTGTVGASNPISTASLGSYAGKIKININGTDRWIPYYA